MSNPAAFPAVPPSQDDDGTEQERLEADPAVDPDEDRPLDADLDDDRLDSADADIRAATEGVIGDDESF